MRRAVLLLLLVSACGKAPEKKPGDTISAGDVAAEARKLKLQPGQWETVTQVTAMDITGIPASQTKAATGTPTRTLACITPAQAARPDAKFLTGTTDANCIYQRFSMTDGRIDAAMTCAPAASAGQGAPGGQAVTMVLAGAYKPAGYTVGLDMKSKLPGGMAMTMKATVTGKRVGECTAGGQPNAR